MMLSKYKFWFLLFFILSLLSLILITRPKAEAFSLNSLPKNTIVVMNESPDAAPAQVTSWTYLDKLKEAEFLVASSSLNLKVGKKDYVYFENRIGHDFFGNPVISQRRLTDPEREIALVIMDTVTGDLDLVNITQRGNDLTYPMEYDIMNVERSNGIRNNAWNTCRQITKPENKAIILNVWPHYVTKRVAKAGKDKRGRAITVYSNIEVVENVVYSPYCDALHLPEFVRNGSNRRNEIAKQALEILRQRGVQSTAFPGNLVSDVIYLKPEFFERLPLIEHMDYGEFAVDPKKSAERVDVILGTNGDRAYALTCSRAGACGWLQYTRPTWNNMKKKYPKAQLPVFEIGAPDHVTSMVAAILLYDNNLAAAIKEFGPTILDDSEQLEEMLAANYNGGTVRPYKALKASILKSLEDWLISPLRTETKQYVEKLRYVRQNYDN
jgi:hypothetical protein